MQYQAPLLHIPLVLLRKHILVALQLAQVVRVDDLGVVNYKCLVPRSLLLVSYVAWVAVVERKKALIQNNCQGLSGVVKG